MIGFKEWLYFEATNTVKDFLTDPTNKDKTFSDIILDFKKSGGEVLNGKFGFVFIYPSWNYIIKIFDDDSCYLQFARFVYSHPHPSFPKLYGPPQKIVPFYKREFPKYYTYVSRVEKLYPVDKELTKEIYNNYHYGTLETDITSFRSDDIHAKRYLQFIKEHPKVKTLYDGLKILFAQNIKCVFDESSSNIMQRINGDLVWSDPFWYGSTPYADVAALSDLNFGDYDYREPNYIQGGEIYKKKRIHKKKTKYKPLDPNEVPF